MKKFVAVLALVVLSFGFVAAQGNGNGWGNGNGGNGNNNSAFGNGGWSSIWPTVITHWLNNGGDIPVLLRLRILNEARPWFQANFGLGPGQILQKYAQGLITITYLPTSPPAPVLYFRVAYDGNQIILVIDAL
jgi:hypothetical protein